MLANRDIDAVLISTPDHQHARLAIQAVQAGKDVYLQKPASLTIAEGPPDGRLPSQRPGRIFQIGSQQRVRWPQFHKARGAGAQRPDRHVANGGSRAAWRSIRALGPAMPIRQNLNYDAWLGSTPEVYYTEIRVHPQTR